MEDIDLSILGEVAGLEQSTITKYKCNANCIIDYDAASTWKQSWAKTTSKAQKSKLVLTLVRERTPTLVKFNFKANPWI